jgi:hypothetical protein
MVCGDLGFKTAAGKPCGQSINATTKKPCVWHATDADGRRAISKLGQIASANKKTLPDLTIGDLTTNEGILATLKGLMEAAATQQVDLRRVGELRQGLSVAVNLRQTAATRELNKTLLRLEHDERAVVLLEQLKADRTLKPLPSLPNQKDPHGHRREN